MRTATSDCLVIGGGLAGWMAAREAVRAGLRVTLLHDGPGASPWVHGLAIPAHPEDSAACFLADTLASGQGLSDPALAAALCYDAPAMLGEIERLGLALNREGEGYQFLRPLGASRPRVMSVGNETGALVLAALRAALKEKVDEHAGVRALRLIVDNGRVCGVLAFDRRRGSWLAFAVGATVLACGGFCGIYPQTTNKRDSGGDGAAMAYHAGATLCDMEFIQFEPSGAVWPASLRGTSMITTMLYEGAVLRNRDGERFMLGFHAEGERVGKDVLAMRIAQEIQAGRGTAHGGVYFDATALGPEMLARLYPSYVERYRRAGIDIAREWVELAPVAHTSLGGVCIDEQGATAVQGLFACGETVGGLHGANRIGGSAGLETLVFGRRAGRAAAAFVANAQTADAKRATEACEAVVHEGGAAADTAAVSVAVAADQAHGGENGDPTALRRIRATLGEALQTGAGVLREREKLTDALRIITQAQAALRGLTIRTPGAAYRRCRLQNDLTTALLVCTAAHEREDSLGCHIRTDAPGKAPAPYHIVLAKGAGGAPVVRRAAAAGCQPPAEGCVAP